MFTTAMVIAGVGAIVLGGYVVNRKKRSQNNNKKSSVKKAVKKASKKVIKEAVQTIAKVPVEIVRAENNMINQGQSVINNHLYSNNQNQENNRSRWLW